LGNIRWEDNSENELKEISRDTVNWILLAQDSVCRARNLLTS